MYLSPTLSVTIRLWQKPKPVLEISRKENSGNGRARWEFPSSQFQLTQITVEITGSRILDLFNFIDQLMGPRGKKKFLLLATARQTAATMHTLLTFILFEFPVVALAEYFNVLGDYANGR